MNPSVDLIFKIAAIGILVSVLNQVLIRSGREEQATMTTIAGIVVVLFMVIQLINDLFITVKTIFRLY
jgi:stage III sporulation protein AC